MDESTWIHRIALSMLKGIGPVHARNLVAYCGGVDPIFTDRKLKNTLEKVPGIGAKLIASITDRKVLAAAEKELAYKRLEENVFDLPGVLSRKKQLLPELLRIIDVLRKN